MVVPANSGQCGRPIMKTIDEHIDKDMEAIEAAKAEGNQGKLRHLEEELKGLQEYKTHHPEDSHDPSPLELSLIHI